MHADRGRGPALAGAVLLMSVSGHVLGGGAMPGAVALSLVAVPALVLAALFSVAPRPPRVTTLAAVFAAFQVLAHVVFHEVTGAVSMSMPAAGGQGLHAGGHGGHGGHEMVQAALAHAATGEAIQALPAAHTPSPLMVTTHLLATVVLAWIAGPAAQQVRGVLRRVLLPLPRLDVDVVRHAADALVVPRISREVGVTVSLRGPPVRFASA